MQRDSIPAGHPTLAVIVPTLDEADELPDLLASLHASGRGAADQPDDLIIVDGGSRDDTVALARESGARTFEADRGRGAQLARGAHEARSDVLVFLHADMRVAPGSLAAVRQTFADPAVSMAGMRQAIEHPGRVYRSIESAADRRVRRGWVYGDSGLCVRRELYEAVGGFRADLPLFEDLDLSRRLRRRGSARLLAEACLHLSARRWQRHGPVRQTVRNWILTLLWKAGVHPRLLARFYPVMRPGGGAVPPSSPKEGGPVVSTRRVR